MQTTQAEKANAEGFIASIIEQANSLRERTRCRPTSGPRCSQSSGGPTTSWTTPSY
jgi:hypothetical protein